MPHQSCWGEEKSNVALLPHCPITYGANGATPGAEIRFYSENRPDPHTIATGRGQIWASERLRSIAVRHGGQLVRAYALNYERSKVSGASILTSIQRFGQDATVDADGKITPGATQPLPPMQLASDSLAEGAAWQLVAENTQPGVFNFGTAPAVAPVYAGPFTKLNVGVGVNPSGEKAPNGTVIGDFDGEVGPKQWLGVLVLATILTTPQTVFLTWLVD